MKKALRRIGRALGLGLAWAVVWAPVAVIVGTLIVDPDDSMDEMWFVVGAYPGFLSGVLFSAGLAIAGGRRRLDEVSLARAAALGALAGLLVGAFPFAAGTPTSAVPLWLLAGSVIGSITLMSALSGMGSTLISRRAAARQLRLDAAR